MLRKFQNFLFGAMPNDATKFYNGIGGFSRGPVYIAEVIIDGNGSVIGTGVKGDASIPVTGTIIRARMMADQNGSAVVDVWKDTFTNYPPTVADTITAAAKPTLAAANHSDDTTLTGWTKTVTVGDTLRFNVDSAATITRLKLEIWIQP